MAYETHGTLNAAKSNAIFWPTCFLQQSWAQREMIGPGKRFDPSKNFIICANTMGNGISFSPTTPGIGDKYPRGGITYHDNVKLQSLLVKSLGVEKLALVYGFSMGCMTALEWAVLRA